MDHRQDLALELSAHSPSDSQHMFQNDLGIQDTYPYLAETDIQKQYMKQHRSGIITRDHFHGFENGEPITAFWPQDIFDEVHVMKRLIPQPLDFDFFGVRFKRGQSKDQLPSVKMVTSLLIRRQYYRDICHLALSRLFKESLTNLRSIRHEWWRLPDDLILHTYHDWTHGSMEELPFGPFGPFWRGRTLISRLPVSLESLHIFEDSKTTRHDLKMPSGPRPSGKQILEDLATSRALGIKHLSVSFLSDAMDCLEISDHTTFPSLQSIALTSQTYLQPEQSFDELLHKAARAAMKMPKLQIMEIWNCENDHAAIFRYEATGSPKSGACRITFKCSWDAAPIADRVVKAWKHVASTVASRHLILATGPLPLASYSQYGSIIGQLKLRDSILHDISQMQVRVDAGSEDEVDVPAWRPTTPYLPSNYSGDSHQGLPGTESVQTASAIT